MLVLFYIAIGTGFNFCLMSKESQRFRVASEMFVLLFFVLMAHSAYGDVSYSLPEEMKRGSVIRNIAKDLGLDVNRLSSRKLALILKVTENDTVTLI